MAVRPETLNTFLQRGHHFLQIKRAEAAAEQFRKALGLEPDSAHILAHLALSLGNAGQWPEAEAMCRRSIANDPTEPMGFYVLAHVCKDTARQHEALAAANSAVRLRPHIAAFWSVKAEAHLALMQFAEALQASEVGIGLDPQHEECRTARSTSLRMLGRSQEALMDAQLALASAPNSAWLHEDHGWCLLELGRCLEAQKHFAEALRINATSESARRGMAFSILSEDRVSRLILGTYTFFQCHFPIVVACMAGCYLLAVIFHLLGTHRLISPKTLIWCLGCYATVAATIALFPLLLALRIHFGVITKRFTYLDKGMGRTAVCCVGAALALLMPCWLPEKMYPGLLIIGPAVALQLILHLSDFVSKDTDEFSNSGDQ